MTDKHLRSIVKAITFRFLATLATIITVFAFTRNFALSFGIGLFDIATKLLIYYFHERAWNSIHWGRTIKVSS